jgi:hypothetical protein
MFEHCVVDNFNYVDMSTKKEDDGLEVNNDENNPTEIPKRDRLDFYNTKAGKKIRLCSQKSKDHLPGTFRRSKCLLCKSETTVKCPTCKVHLCMNKYRKNKMRCFDKFHTVQHLVEISQKEKKSDKSEYKDENSDEDMENRKETGESNKNGEKSDDENSEGRDREEDSTAESEKDEENNGKNNDYINQKNDLVNNDETGTNDGKKSIIICTRDKQSPRKKKKLTTVTKFNRQTTLCRVQNINETDNNNDEKSDEENINNKKQKTSSTNNHESPRKKARLTTVSKLNRQTTVGRVEHTNDEKTHRVDNNKETDNNNYEESDDETDDTSNDNDKKQKAISKSKNHSPRKKGRLTTVSQLNQRTTIYRIDRELFQTPNKNIEQKQQLAETDETLLFSTSQVSNNDSYATTLKTNNKRRPQTELAHESLTQKLTDSNVTMDK